MDKQAFLYAIVLEEDLDVSPGKTDLIPWPFGFLGLPDQTFEMLLIGFDVKIRSKNLIRV
jgi:hypothetical protein